MKDEPSKSRATDYLREQFGDLSEEEFSELSNELSDGGDHVHRDAQIDKLLREASPDPSEEAPPLPAKVKARFETARLESENAQSGADVYALPKRYSNAAEKSAFVGSRLHTSAVIMGGLAAAAAIAIAYVSLIRPVIPQTVVTFAEAITLLTPGPETGFLEPVFTWNSGNGGVVDVRVLSEDGSEIAALENAFSPLRWGAMERDAALETGRTYQLEISVNEEVLETRSFTTASTATGAPAPGETLEEIIEQCRGYIEASRPADAWMLWGELTGEQKSDPRMQELKTEILAVIAG